MNHLRKLIPDFLLQWDLDLQRSHPRLWSTRFHLHLWFLLLINVVVFVLGMILPVDPRRFPEPEELFGYMLVPATVYFAFWTYKVVLFSVNKRFGSRSPIEEVVEFLVLLCSILLIWSIPYNLASTVAWRAANTVDDGTFAAHIDQLNLSAHAFIVPAHYTYYDYYEEFDHGHGSSHAFFRSLQEYRLRKLPGTKDEQPLQAIYTNLLTRYQELRNNHLGTYDPVAAAAVKNSLDSIEKNFPFYFIAHGHYTPPYGKFQTLPDTILEDRYIDQVERPLDHEAISEALRISLHYSDQVEIKDAFEIEKDLNERERSDTKINTAKIQINRIAKAKAAEYFFTRWDEFLTVIFIFSFGLSMLVSIFKSIYWQPFLIAIVTTGVTPIIILILGLVFARDLFGTYEGEFFAHAHYLILLVMIIAVPFVMQLTAYRTVWAVTTILANVAVPFFALFTLYLLDNDLDIFGLKAMEARYSDDWGFLQEEVRLAHAFELQELRKKIDLWYLGVLWAGMIVYSLVLHPLFQSVHARLMALPERK